MPVAPRKLFRRACSVQVGTLLIPATPGNGLRVKFNVKRGVHVTAGCMKPRPNTCDLRIWNLSEPHQQQLSQATAQASPRTTVPCILSAGYQGAQMAIFNGQLRAGNTVSEGADDVTQLSTGDGDKAIGQRLNVALGHGATAKQVLQTIVAGLGIGQGNLAKAVALLEASPLGAQLFVRGCLLKGSAPDIMTDFCRSVGLSWSVQDGALQVTSLNQPLDGEAILVDAGHGLVGSPTLDTAGILSLTMLLAPGVVPGAKLVVDAARLSGGYRVVGVESVGDTFETEWYHKVEAVRL